MALSLTKNLKQRVFGALLLLPPVLAIIYLGDLWFTGLLMVGGAFMVFEWHRMTRVAPLMIKLSSLSFVAAACLFGFLISPTTPIAMVILGMAIPLLLVFTALSDLDEHKSPILHMMRWSGNGTLYVALPMMALAWIRGIGGNTGGLGDMGMLYVFWTFLIVWAVDVGGYFFGKGIGGPKLAPKISPNKTWAGFIGGTVLAMFVTWILVLVVGDPRMGYALGAAALVGMVSQIGDLFESAIKRAFNVKDSGQLIPGHGGILDRVDGLVFAAPLMAVLLDVYVAN